MAVAIAAVFLSSGLAAHAVTFDITYDNVDDMMIGGAVVGAGTFSFDGSATPGEYPLDSLVDLQFSAVVAGTIFSTTDIDTDLSLSNLLIFDQAGQTLATFTGEGGIAAGGSFDLTTPGGELLSHEPGPAGAPCCGGSDPARLYFSGPDNGPDVVFGNFQMVLVPEPSTAALGMIVCALAAIRTRR